MKSIKTLIVCVIVHNLYSDFALSILAVRRPNKKKHGQSENA